MKNVMKFMDNHQGTAICGILVTFCTIIAVMYNKFLNELLENDSQEDEV